MASQLRGDKFCRFVCLDYRVLRSTLQNKDMALVLQNIDVYTIEMLSVRTSILKVLKPEQCSRV